MSGPKVFACLFDSLRESLQTYLIFLLGHARTVFIISSRGVAFDERAFRRIGDSFRFEGLVVGVSIFVFDFNYGRFHHISACLHSHFGMRAIFIRIAGCSGRFGHFVTAHFPLLARFEYVRPGRFGSLLDFARCSRVTRRLVHDHLRLVVRLDGVCGYFTIFLYVFNALQVYVYLTILAIVVELVAFDFQLTMVTLERFAGRLAATRRMVVVFFNERVLDVYRRFGIQLKLDD